jgi:hypothetical protein
MMDDPPQPEDGSYVYHRPHRENISVRPGKGADELSSFPLEPDHLIERVRRAIPAYNGGGVMGYCPSRGLSRVFEFLGAPRAWQLGGEVALCRLRPEELKIIQHWTAVLLNGEDGCEKPAPGNRYLQRPIDSGLPGDYWDKWDLRDVETVEDRYWPFTMPIEFAHSILRLESHASSEADLAE